MTMADRLKKNIAELTRCSAGEYREKEKIPLTVLADNVRSMHNVGSIFRTADAFLVREVVLCGITGCPPHPEIEKTALGADATVVWRYAEDSVAETARLKGKGYVVCALEQAHDSVELGKYIPPHGKEILLVVGNEVKGVDQRIVDMADTVLEIPQEGVKHSLNVSVSAGIAMWHFYNGL